MDQNYAKKRTKFKNINRYKLFVEDMALWEDYCNRDYFIDIPIESHLIQNGIISVKHNTNGTYVGGVYDADGRFIDGHTMYFAAKRTPPPPVGVTENANMYIHETVVYGGAFSNHYGHMLTESLSRLWWFIENPDSNLKFVFVPLFDSFSHEIMFKELYFMIGLREENIILLKQTTQFDAVIVPNQSYYAGNGYTDKAMMVFNKIRENVKPADYKKLYLTRQKLPVEDARITNEEYFEEYYRSSGYQVISPELLSVQEKVAIMSGATDVVVTSGTTHVHTLFCKQGINLTLLPRIRRPHVVECWINQAKSANCTVIDVSTNILPASGYKTSWLFLPNVYWKQYLKNHTDKASNNDGEMSIELFKTMVKNWTKAFEKRQPIDDFYSRCSLADVIIRMNEYICGDVIDEKTKEKLYYSFPSRTSMENQLNMMLRIHDFCRSYRNIYLYGAGENAKLIAARMISHNIDFKCFVVSDGQKKNDELMGKRIYFLSEINEIDAGFIIALNPKNTNEILPLLKEKGFVNLLTM